LIYGTIDRVNIKLISESSNGCWQSTAKSKGLKTADSEQSSRPKRSQYRKNV